MAKDPCTVGFTIAAAMPAVEVANAALSPIKLRILNALQTEALTVDQLVEAACVSRNTLLRTGYLRQLCAARLIHIAAWRRPEKGHPIPVYAAGDAEDAPKPEPLADNERKRNWRVRSQYNMRRRLEREAARPLNRLDPLLAVFMPAACLIGEAQEFAESGAKRRSRAAHVVAVRHTALQD